MAIDLGGLNNSPARSKVGTTQTPNGADTAKSAKPASTNPTPLNSDTFQLSGEAKAIKLAQQQLAKTPDVDQAKVDQIKAAIADGSYEIDAQKVAEKITSFDEQLG